MARSASSSCAARARRCREVRRLIGPLLAVSFVLVLAVHVPHLGVAVHGARRWLGSGRLQFEPSELLKLALVLYTATLLASRSPRAGRWGGCRLARVYPAAARGRRRRMPAGREPAGSRHRPGIAFTTAALVLAAGVPARHLAIIAGSTLGLVPLYALALPYARTRLTSFLDPWAHASTTGFQAVQGQIAIGSGGLFGGGPGQSVQKDV